MVETRLSWQEWRSGGEELLMLRDLAPSVSEEVLAAAWRLYDRADTSEARDDALTLICGCEEAAKKATKEDGCS